MYVVKRVTEEYLLAEDPLTKKVVLGDTGTLSHFDRIPLGKGFARLGMQRLFRPGDKLDSDHVTFITEHLAMLHRIKDVKPVQDHRIMFGLVEAVGTDKFRVLVPSCGLTVDLPRFHPFGAECQLYRTVAIRTNKDGKLIGEMCLGGATREFEAMFEPVEPGSSSKFLRLWFGGPGERLRAICSAAVLAKFLKLPADIPIEQLYWRVANRKAAVVITPNIPGATGLITIGFRVMAVMGIEGVGSILD